MAREIKSAHLASAALAKGGFAQMAPADYGRVGARLKEQYRFLNRFASQIESGQQGLNGQLPIRSEMYIQAARATYHATERREMEQRGVEEERSILGAADHCPDCLQEADKDWQLIGTLIPIGDRICLTRCACVFDYRGAGVE
jgi:ferredoxin